MVMPCCRMTAVTPVSAISNFLSNLTHTHTHTPPLNGPLSGTTRLSRYQKGKPIWILLKQETVSGSGICWAICKSAPCSRQITMPAPHHSVFYRPDALPAAQPTVSKHWRHCVRNWIYCLQSYQRKIDLIMCCVTATGYIKVAFIRAMKTSFYHVNLPIFLHIYAGCLQFFWSLLIIDLLHTFSVCLYTIITGDIHCLI